MKRITTFAVALIFSLGLSVSAQAVNINFEEGTSAHALFSAIPGIKFVDNQADIISNINASASTYYDLYLLGSEGIYDYALGSGTGSTDSNDYTKNSNFNKFDYDGGFDANGLYTGNNKIKENVLLADVTFELYSGGLFGYYNLGNAKHYEIKEYHEPSKASGNRILVDAIRFQMFIVTDDSVEINGNIFYKGSIIFAADDGYFSSIDHNEYVFVLGAPSPAVPLPGAVFLLAPGLAGIAVLRKKMA